MSSFRSQKGFVLVATLWTLAAVTLVAGFFALWTQLALQRAREGQEDVQALVDLNGTRATLLYFFAVQHITLAGLSVPVPPDATKDEAAKQLSAARRAEDEANPMAAAARSLMPAGGEIALEDTVYMGLGRARFSIQDEGGLLAVNFMDPIHLENLLGLLDVPAPQRSPLVDKLLDYIDEDNLVRLNGAEAADYKKAGLPPPPNRLLLTSWEARNVLGWKEATQIWKAGRFARLTSTSFATIPNPNTAPALVLQTLPGVDDETARRIMQIRKHAPFMSPEDIDLAAGKFLNINPLALHLLPSKSERITLWLEGRRRMKEIHVELTPRAHQKAPWMIDYALELPLTNEQESIHAQPVSTPLFTSPVSANPK